MKTSRLSLSENTYVEVSHFGAHIVSWTVNGQEQLYLSPLSAHDSGKAIRGGIPLIFPQFEKFGPGSRHGFARTSTWIEKKSDKGLTFFLDSESADTQWPHRAEALFSVELDDKAITLTFTVTNTGNKTFDFTGALHSYFSVSDINRTEITGLQHLDYWCNGDSFQQRQNQKQATIEIHEKVDRMYFNANAPVHLLDTNRQLTLTSQGFNDLVVWNPWERDAEQLADLPSDDYQKFVCVEPAQVDKPITLAPSEQWTGKHRIEASSL